MILKRYLRSALKFRLNVLKSLLENEVRGYVRDNVRDQRNCADSVEAPELVGDYYQWHGYDQLP